jgi:hypothetical protein
MNTCKKQNTEGGQVMILISLFLLAGSLVLVHTLFTIVQSQVFVAREFSISKNMYIYTEGALEDVVYRHKNALLVSPTETLTNGSVSVVTTTTDILGDKEILAIGNEDSRTRSIQVKLIEGNGASFSFGVQTDQGGIVMENNSSINGNVYSNGSVVGSGLNLVKGSVISAGPFGFISEVHATGSAYAHTINDSYVEEDAFYTSIDMSTMVDGVKHAGSADLSTSTLPISDTLIDGWAAYASSSAILSAECAASGGHIIYDYDVTLGPAMIPCDVTFEKSPTITIAGVLWIVGDLKFKNGPEFEIDAGIGNKSVPLIVDDPTDRLNSGTVVMSNSGSWTGNGNRSYIMIISRNESAEQGGAVSAITLQQSNGGALLVYANHGEITLENNTDLTEITAYRLRMRNNTEVEYDSGLASAIFTAGPGGGYEIDSWREVE